MSDNISELGLRTLTDRRPWVLALSCRVRVVITGIWSQRIQFNSIVLLHR